MFFCEILHIFIYLSYLLPFLISNKKILYNYLFFLYLIYSGWILLNNICVITVFEKIKNNEIKVDQGFNYRINKLFNTNFNNIITELIFTTLVSSIVLITTYKLNIFKIGLLWILIFEFYKYYLIFKFKYFIFVKLITIIIFIFILKFIYYNK